MTDLIKKALNRCGYDCDPTEENLIDCFLDYVASGAFANLDYEEAKDLIEEGEITLKMMCINLSKVR